VGWRRERENQSIEAQVVWIGRRPAAGRRRRWGEDGLVVDLGKGKGDSPKMARGGGAVVGEREKKAGGAA
jgi:hypothetical protein